MIARRRPQQRTVLTHRNRAARVIWGAVWSTLYRWSPTPLHGWRRMLLRLFGARIGAGAHPYPRARIWAPWNLTMGEHSSLANDVDCYSVAAVRLGDHVTVSQYSYLCTASHDHRDPAMPLTSAPIEIGSRAWIAADCFIGPGVTVGEGAVVGARSTVMHDVGAWLVVAGHPAQPRGQRTRAEPGT